MTNKCDTIIKLLDIVIIIMYITLYCNIYCPALPFSISQSINQNFIQDAYRVHNTMELNIKNKQTGIIQHIYI